MVVIVLLGTDLDVIMTYFPDDDGECASNDCDQLCMNLPGSYTCACQAGYLLDRDRRTCVGMRNYICVLLHL